MKADVKLMMIYLHKLVWSMKRFFLLILAVVTLAACRQDTTVIEQKTIGYIPLDDRPVNYDRAVWLCGSMGFRILIPDKETIGTRLDNMAPFPDGRTCGNREKLLAWLKASEGKCDCYVISADQMLSGGLVSSRWLCNTDLSLEDSICDYLKYLSARYPVIIFDTVMRLASTIGYGGYTEDEYERFREYGMEARLQLEGQELTVGNIVSNYEKDRNGTELGHYGLTDAQIGRYLASRTRKLMLSDRLLSGENSFFKYYIGVDDSHPDISIQSNEIRYLSGLLGDNGTVSSGCDELGLTGIAAMAVREYPGIRVNVQYFGGKEKEYADRFDYLPLEAAVSNRISSLGIGLADDSEHLNVLVLTRSDNYADARAELLERAEELVTAGKAVSIIDPNTNMVEDQKTELGKELLESDIPLLELMGYSSWNTASNAIGIGLANSVARYGYLMQGKSTEESNLNFIKALGFSYLKDISYKSCGFGESQKDSREKYSFNYVLDRLNRSELTDNLKDFSTVAHGPLKVSGFSRPWGRNFEILFEVTE